MPRAADFPVPNRPRTTRPSRRAWFSPCISKNLARSSRLIPEASSSIVIPSREICTITVTGWPARGLSIALDTYSHTTMGTVLKYAAF